MDLTDRRVPITGGSGFMGSQLAENLLKTGNRVIVADDFSTDHKEVILNDAVMVRVDCNMPDVGPEFEYVGGDREWTGDAPWMRLSSVKLSIPGWVPHLKSKPGIRRAAEELIKQLHNISNPY